MYGTETRDITFLSRLLESKKIVSDVILAYNNWISYGIMKQMEVCKVTFMDKAHGVCTIEFVISRIDPPKYSIGKEDHDLYASEAADAKLSLLAKVYATYKVRNEATGALVYE